MTLNEDCPNCKNKETYHHDTEDTELLICPICNTEFYAKEERECDLNDNSIRRSN